MADHDPLCATVTWVRAGMEPEEACNCALIARVRADERQHTPYSRTAAGVVSRILSEADMAARPGQYDRLVAIANEVAALTRWKDEATAVIEAWERVHALLGKPGFIGESKAEATWVEVRDLLDARSEANRDRDAARAEVAALRERYTVEEFIDTDGYPSMRVVKGEHVGQNEWAANVRREVLADLRAKVEGMRDEAKADPVGSAVWRTTAYESVLALIEEAERG